MSKHSEACCSIPAVISTGYSAKGDYSTIGGLKTYVTGPKDAETAILVIYDIFGFKDQIIQGADILATADNEKKYQVFMPDFFEGDPADINNYPPKTEEAKAALGEWFKKAAPPIHLPKIPSIQADAAKLNPNIKQWGAIGYCWGGKMVSLAGAGDHFKVGVQTSPAMVDPEDATKVKIPMAVLASKEEPAEDVKKYVDNLTVPKHAETFGDQLHGFMSARADLKDEKVKAEYERGYHVALKFFHDHL